MARRRFSPFDLILMDLQMPGVDGFEATAMIRAGEQTNGTHTPIIATTAHASREQCLAAGMDGHVEKPISAAILFAEMDRVLGSNTSPEAAAESSASLPHDQSAELPAAPVFDEVELLNRVNHDTAFLAELIDLFQIDSRDLLLKLRDAVERRDQPALSRAAHSFKGMVGNFCAPAASRTALELELLAKEAAFDAALATLQTLDAQVARLKDALEHWMQDLTAVPRNGVIK
jgi:CheY-like chemotaxis protein